MPEFNDTKKFTEYVKNYVYKTGKTQQWIADKLGIGQPAVNHALNNTEPGRYDKTRADILGLFGCEVEKTIKVK